MKIETREKIIIIITLLFVVFLIGSYINYSIENKDWWTRALCSGEGELEEKRFYDICWIEGNGYLAKFEGTGKYYSNLTTSSEIVEWKLVEK